MLPELPDTPNAITGSVSLIIVVRVAIVQIHVPGVVSVIGFRGRRPVIVTGEKFFLLFYFGQINLDQNQV